MYRLVVLALLVPSLLFAQQSFDGSYVHQSPQGPVTLMLQQAGTMVTGSMRGADGSMFQLQGELVAEGAAGRISISGGAGFFAVGHVNGVLQLIVAEVDPATGQPDLTNGWSLEFMPTSASARMPAMPGAPQGTPGGQPQAAVQRDPALVGYWTFTERYSSGDFFANTTYQMLVNPDGTYQYGAGNVSLGGNFQGNTGQSGNVSTGQWRTEGGVIYIMEQGSMQWAPYARYYVEGASMMLTFDDGTRQLWERGR